MFSRDDKLQEIAFEVAMRRSVYARRIREGKMTAALAGRKIAIMLEIAKDYGGHGDQNTEPHSHPD